MKFRLYLTTLLVFLFTGCDPIKIDLMTPQLVYLSKFFASNNGNEMPPSALTYAGSPFTFAKDVSITMIIPTVTGTVTNCSSSPTLPTGLSIHLTTCAISGIPTALQAATAYTITASNASGSTTATISIAVTASSPSSLTYTGNPYTFTQGMAITTITPTVTGTITSCTSAPLLPSGLNLNSTTCAISGIPTVVQVATSYTITASNSSGSTTAQINITVTNMLLVATPTFAPPAGLYTTPQNISMSSTTTGANIYYTLDGSTPTTGSTLYSAAVHIWFLAGNTIQAYATKAGMVDSSVLSGIFSYPPLKTGQTSCYDVSNNPVACGAYTGQDAQENQGVTRSYTGPTQHPTYTSDYTTTDNATGLVWRTCSQGQSGAACAGGAVVQLNWANAESDPANGCSALNSANSGNGYAGKTNWRLPTVWELSTLVDAGKTPAPTINVTAFPATQSSGYWSSTTYALATSDAWYVYFGYGYVGSTVKTNNNYVRCVSGPSNSGTQSFTDNSDGTVKDNATGLLWQKCSRGQTNDATCSGSATTATWANAHIYCNSLSLASKTWRLPNRNELQSIVDYTKVSSPTINAIAFPATQLSNYWSSTTYALVTSNTWVVSFDNGSVGYNYAKAFNYYVRCVSGP